MNTINAMLILCFLLFLLIPVSSDDSLSSSCVEFQNENQFGCIFMWQKSTPYASNTPVFSVTCPDGDLTDLVGTLHQRCARVVLQLALACLQPLSKVHISGMSGLCMLMYILCNDSLHFGQCCHEHTTTAAGCTM